MFSNPKQVNPLDIPAGAPTCVKPKHPGAVLYLILVMLAIAFGSNVYQALSISCPVGVNAQSCTRPVPLISNEVIVQIAAMIVAAVILIRQLTFSASPAIGYTALQQKPAHLLTKNSDQEAWTVTVSSNGSGPAFLTGVFYDVMVNGIENNRNNLSYEAAWEFLVSNGLQEYSDFCIRKLSAGAALAPGHSSEMFECSAEKWGDVIQRVDCIVFYKGRMGDHWAKRIRCIPNLQSPMAHKLMESL
jgi:hypothetical protein